MSAPALHLMASFCYHVQNFTQPFIPSLHFYKHIYTAVKIASILHQKDVNSYEFITFTESFLDKRELKLFCKMTHVPIICNKHHAERGKRIKQKKAFHAASSCRASKISFQHYVKNHDALRLVKT